MTMRKAVYEEWAGRRPINLGRLAGALHKVGIGCSSEDHGNTHLAHAGALVEAYLADNAPYADDSMLYGPDR